MSDENGNHDNVVGEEGKLYGSSGSGRGRSKWRGGGGSQEVGENHQSISDDPQVLKDCVAALKLVLAQKKESPQVREFLASDDFQGFLKKCLKAKSDDSSLHVDTAWIIWTILKDKIKSSVGSSGIVPLLIKLLGTSGSDMAVVEQLTETIGLIGSEDPRMRKELSATSNSNVLLKTLARLLKAENPLPSDQLFRNAATILMNMIDVRAITRAQLKDVSQLRKMSRTTRDSSGVNWHWYMADDIDLASGPTPALLQNALPVISILADSKIEEVRDKQLQHICLSLTVITDSFAPFVGNGICGKLASYLETGQVIGVATALGTIVHDNNVMPFLTELQKEGGFKFQNFWRCMKIVVEDPSTEVTSKAVLSFMDQVRINSFPAIHFDINVGVVDTIFESGYAHALAHALKNDVPHCCIGIGVHTLAVSCCLMSDYQKQALVDLGIVPHLVNLMNKSLDPDEVKCVATLIGTLVNGRSEQRDAVIKLEIIPILLRTIRNHRADKGTLDNLDYSHRAIKALECILKVEPKAPLATFKNSLGALTDFLARKRDKGENTMILALNCVMKLAEYGQEGLSAVFAEPRLIPAVAKLLNGSMTKLRLKAAELVFQMTQDGNAEQRGRLESLNILEGFRADLTSSTPSTRKMALHCLMMSLDNQRVAFRNLLNEQLKPLVMAELVKRHPETFLLAGILYDKMID